MDELTALLEPNAPGLPDDQPIGFRGDFIDVQRHNGAVWVTLGDKPFARVFDQDRIEAFWQAYNRGLGVAREIARQGI